MTHPLMPGIRSLEINNTDWPRTLHDKQLTGFSPLSLGMADEPVIWHSVDVPGAYHWIETVKSSSGPAFLVDDGRLSLYDVASADCYWSVPFSGHLVFWGDLFGIETESALIRQGNRLWVVDGSTGEIQWQHTAEPPHVDLRVCIGQVLPGVQGLQAAVFEQYGEDGWLLSFESDGSVREVWRRQVISNDVWPVRADHGCDVALDPSAVPLLWNVRHHRCQSFEAATGEPVGCVEYELDGAFRRNYGPWRIGTGAGGRRAITVVSEMVQTHVHGLILHEDGTPELAWERYYGEVYVVPGVAVEFLGVEDVDGDGAHEVVYNVRDPENDFRSFTRCRDVATGEVKYEFEDHWCSAFVSGVGASQQALLLLHPASEGATPEQGPAKLVSLTAGRPETRMEVGHGGPWGITAVAGQTGSDLLLRIVDSQGPAVVRFDGSTFEEIDRLTAAETLDSPAAASARVDGVLQIASTCGTFQWPHNDARPFDLAGGAPPTLSAADQCKEGAAMLYAHVPGQRLLAWSFSSGRPRQTRSESFLGETARMSPLLYDLDGDGEYELIIPDASATGELTVRARRASGDDLWNVTLPDARTDDRCRAVAWNAGEFLLDEDHPGGARAAVAISVYSHRRILEGTYLLDGITGAIHWFRGIFHDGDVIRAYRPCGIPGAFDWDGDGAEEIAWDMYSYMAFLKGDAEFAGLFGGPNVRPEEEAVPAISLYNGFTPVYRSETDERPHWLIHHGHGRFGLVGTEPTTGIWHEEVGYDTPDRIGFVDVDGDGVLEVGYALRNSTEFVCRDLWTGESKWTLELPSAPQGPVLTADVDGDGKGEFLVDRWCIGTDASGQGEIRWTSPVCLGWAVIADFDGDGVGEIACPNQGKITILKAPSRE